MMFRTDSDLLQYMDVSMIMVLQKDTSSFKKNIAHNSHFLRSNGMELIIVITEQQENEIPAIINDYPLLSWRVLVVNDNTSDGAAINAGILHANNRYILVIDPDAFYFGNIVYQMRYIAARYAHVFVTGMYVAYPDPAGLTLEMITQHSLREGAALLADRNTLQQVAGFADKDQDAPGALIDEISERLEWNGVRKMAADQAICIVDPRDDIRFDQNEPAYGKNIFCRQTVITPPRPVDQIERECFHWKYQKPASLVNSVLSAFESYEITNDRVFEQFYRVICLVQVRNEAHYLPEALEHLQLYCDGIILLDDGSDDDSFEKACCDKLLIKARKRYNGYFDDLGNRNQLLQLGHLFNTDWFYFMDADERFDERFSDIFAITEKKGIDSVRFRCVHLWDQETQYRKNIPEGRDGVLYRFRMFRNKGFMQIASGREIYFPATPFTTNPYDAKVLIRHFGLMEASVRQRKYGIYKAQDKEGKKQGYGYEYLLDTEYLAGNISDIVL